jgi:predicted PurR-regulated permease PerM
MAEKKSFPFLSTFTVCAVLFYAAYRLNHVLLPFFLSAALAYILNPLINSLESRGLRRQQIVLTLYAAAAFLLYLGANSLLSILTQEVANIQEHAPQYLKNAQKAAEQLQASIAKNVPYGRLAIEHAASRMYGPLVENLQHVPTLLLGLFPLLSLFFLVPFITFLLLLDGPGLIGSAVQECPSRYVEQALHLISEIDTSLGNYLRGIIIVALAIAAASFTGLLAMGVNYALAIALLSGLSSFVPYLGVILGSVVGFLVAFFQFGTPMAGLKVIALFLGIRLADEALLMPVISKHSVHLHPLVFLLSLLVGGELFGFMGLVFAIPAACVVKALVKVAWAWYASEARLTGLASYDCAVIPYT